MKKNIIEVYFENKLNENDVLVYRHNRWIAISKSLLFDETKRGLNGLNDKIEEEKSNRIKDVADLVEENNNLKKVISYLLGDDYENVLKQLESEDLTNENEENE